MARNGLPPSLLPSFLVLSLFQASHIFTLFVQLPVAPLVYSSFFTPVAILSPSFFSTRGPRGRRKVLRDVHPDALHLMCKILHVQTIETSSLDFPRINNPGYPDICPLQCKLHVLRFRKANFTTILQDCSFVRSRNGLFSTIMRVGVLFFFIPKTHPIKIARPIPQTRLQP
jgi:hypothetical protein